MVTYFCAVLNSSVVFFLSGAKKYNSLARAFEIIYSKLDIKYCIGNFIL